MAQLTLCLSRADAPMSSDEAPAVTPRALTRLHHDPLQAFESADGGRTGRLDLKSARIVLQGLGTAPSALEMAHLARQYGDGSSIDYRRMLDSVVGAGAGASGARAAATPGRGRLSGAPATPSAASARSPAAPRATPRAMSPIRALHTERPVPGNPARPDGVAPRPEDAADSRLLKFASDSDDYVTYVHGNAGHTLAQPGFAGRRGLKMEGFGHAGRDDHLTSSLVEGDGGLSPAPPKSGRKSFAAVAAPHAPVPSALSFPTAASASAAAAAPGEAAAPAEPSDDSHAYMTGKLVEAGSLAKYMSTDASPPPPGYLPLFPGDQAPKLRNHDPIVHGGKMATLGGVVNYINDETWRDEHPEGYLPPLPNGMGGEVPKRAVTDALHHSGNIWQPSEGGMAAWGADSAHIDELNARHREAHVHPLHHNSEIRDAGGIAGIANSARSWLQDTPTAPGKVVQTTPEKLREERAKSCPRSRSPGVGRSHSMQRRRSVPDLIVRGFQPPPPAAAGGEVTDSDRGGEGGADGPEDIRKMQSDILRSNRATFEQHFSIGGPLTNSVTGEHHERPGRLMGSRSPTAVILSASQRPDLRRLALVRKHLRSLLPSKTTAAQAVVRARLAGKDGDGDGRLTDAELHSALASMMPDVHADEVGLLIRHMRSRNARRAAAAQKSPSAVASVDADGPSAGSTSPSAAASARRAPAFVSGPASNSEELSQLSVATAGFGEGISIAEVAEWVSLQPGGSEEVLVPRSGPPLAAGFAPDADYREGGSGGGGGGDDNEAANSGGGPHADHGKMRRFAVEVELGRHHHARPAFDSTMVSGLIAEEGVPFRDPRDEERAEAERLRRLDDDVVSLATSYTLLSNATGRHRPGAGAGTLGSSGASTYSQFHEARRAAMSPHAKGSARVPAAGLLSGELKERDGKKLVDGEGAALKESANEDPATARERAANVARFENFRVRWEEKHGAPARKEAALDAQEPAEGKTWTRAEPQPFRVVKLSSPAPVPPSNPRA